MLNMPTNTGQEYKTATVTKQLANRANIPAFVLLYKISETCRNPSDENYYDIESFRYKSIGNVSPSGKPDYDWIYATPKEWANLLMKVRAYSAKNLGIFVM